MELLEYVNYNFMQKNDVVVNILEDLIQDIENKFEIEDKTAEQLRRKIYIAYGCAKGYTEYKTKALANMLGVSKTAVKYMSDKLQEEGTIILIKPVI